MTSNIDTEGKTCLCGNEVCGITKPYCDESKCFKEPERNLIQINNKRLPSIWKLLSEKTLKCIYKLLYF